MKNDCLSHCFNGEKYDRVAVANLEIFDDFLIFDLSDGCRFIARRPNAKINVDGESVYDLMSKEGACELREYLLSYDMRPMVVKTLYGLAAVVPSLVPSSSLGVMVFMRMGMEKVCACAKKRSAELLFSKELSPSVGAGHAREAELYDCELAVRRIHDALYCTSAGEAEGGDVTCELERGVYAASVYVSCPVFLACAEPAVCVAGFDLPMLQAFLIVILSCAKEISLRERATVSIESNDHGVSVMVSIEMKKGRSFPEQTIRTLGRIADRNRMLFEVMCDSLVTHLRFSPVRRDWSLLEIKTPGGDESACPEKSE